MYTLSGKSRLCCFAQHWFLHSQLHIFNDIDENFSFYGKSAMDELQSADTQGRPFGWVALQHMVVLVYVFTRLMHENKRSQDAVDTSNVNASWYNFITRGMAALSGFNARRTSSIVCASVAMSCSTPLTWLISASKSVSQLELSPGSVLWDRKFL